VRCLAERVADSEAELRGPFDWSRDQYLRFVGSGGLEGNTINGQHVVLLSTINPTTKRVRRSPLMRVKRGAEYAAIGSHGGSPEHPGWYADIRANPVVTLQDGVLKAVYRAHEATGREREIWWQRAVEAWPVYNDDQNATSRKIPVIVLTPEV
jgi:deazaflavin-dependent oxidoreductase (nitroreductase family)